MSPPTKAPNPTSNIPLNVTITSYSRRLGPLQPPPHLTYDLRSMPSPPKTLPTSCDGRDARLRGFLMEFPVFVALLNEAFEQIIRFAGLDPDVLLKDEDEDEGGLAVGTGGDQMESTRDGTGEEVSVAEGSGCEEGRSGAGEMESDLEDEAEDEAEDETDDETEAAQDHERAALGDSEAGKGNKSDNDGPIAAPAGDHEIRVGVFCVLGRHRSAAFAEQLASMQWPRGSSIRVQHRDINQRWKKKKKQKTVVKEE